LITEEQLLTVLGSVQQITEYLEIYSNINLTSLEGLRSLANVAVMAEVLVDGQGRVKGVRATPATFDKERLPMIDASGRALHLINWFNRQASRTLPGFEPLNFPAQAEQQDGFRKWLRSPGGRIPPKLPIPIVVAGQICRSKRPDRSGLAGLPNGHPMRPVPPICNPNCWPCQQVLPTANPTTGR
jgi:hypothetical protein